MKKFFFTLVTLFVSLGFSTEQQFSKMYVLGDSLFDNGNTRFFSCAGRVKKGELDPGQFQACLAEVAKAPSCSDSSCVENRFPLSEIAERFTNGKVAIEVLAEKLSQKGMLKDSELKPARYSDKGVSGTNFATLGATSSNENAEGTPSDPSGYRKSINFDSQLKQLLKHNPNFDTEALYVISFGGNDLRSARGKFKEVYENGVKKNKYIGPDSKEINPLKHWSYKKVSRLVRKQAIKQFSKNLNSLLEMGAKHILVLKAMDIGTIPETSMIHMAWSKPEYLSEKLGISMDEAKVKSHKYRRLAPKNQIPGMASKSSKLYNRALRRAIDELSVIYEVKIYTQDVIEPVNKMVNDNIFQNTTHACKRVKGYSYYPGCSEDKEDAWLYNDEAHPNKLVHEYVANEMFEKVTQLYQTLNHTEYVCENDTSSGAPFGIYNNDISTLQLLAPIAHTEMIEEKNGVYYFRTQYNGYLGRQYGGRYMATLFFNLKKESDESGHIKIENLNMSVFENKILKRDKKCDEVNDDECDVVFKPESTVCRRQ